MAMVDMKRSAAERKKDSEPMKMEGDDYPYGLHVHLDHDQLEKLGVTELPKVGDKLHLHAHAHVTEVSEEHRDGGKKRRHVRLQMRKMELKKAAKSHEESDEESRAGAKAAIDAALKPDTDHDDE